MKKGKRICSFALALVLCMGSLPGMASAAMKSVKITQKGQVVDSITFNGVTVNAIYAPPNSISGYSSDATYCCAAFVSKFYRQVYGIGVGHLSRKYNGPYVYSGSGSFSKTNDPQVGDILWNLTSKTTHWAIVKEVGSTDVTVIEQNGWYKKAEGTARVGKTYSKTSPSVTFYHYNPGSTNVSGGTTSGENVSVAFSNYQVRKLTETSAEPYATATATNGLVKKVGMRIGTNKDKLQLLGSDNGKAGTRKNMWYNTTKYNYPLQPGTTYYYQPFAEVDGKEYKGEVRSFTTPPGTTPTQKEEDTTTKICSHSYNSKGYCSKCGQEYPMTITYLIPAATYEAVKNDVPVRNRPYAPEEIIKSLSKGEKVSVVASGKNSVGNLWYKLDDGTWVYSENLKKAATSLDTQPAKPEPAAPANTYTALVTCNADILNVRKGPGTSYDKVGGLERGSKCTVYPNQASSGWIWVEGSGVSGYVSANKLTTFTGNTRTGEATCKADLLNVRKGPGTSYDKVGQIPRGATCTVYLDVKADWYFVSYGGFSGYASKNMITLR